jgi:hypothetical protein
MISLVYDCEIVKAIPNGQKKKGIEYCEGWGNFEGMGVSVIRFKLGEDETDHCLHPLDFLGYLMWLDSEDSHRPNTHPKRVESGLVVAL